MNVNRYRQLVYVGIWIIQPFGGEGGLAGAERLLGRRGSYCYLPFFVFYGPAWRI